jgi:hypothetical protein
MALRDDIPVLIETYNDNQAQLDHHAQVFDIFEGNLLEHVLADLKGQLNERSFKVASKRVSPINVLTRLIDKLSKIYAKAPMRTVNKGTEADTDLMNRYVEEMDLNTEMGSSSGANGFFNLFKRVWIEPFKDENGSPKLRVLPADQFFVYSSNKVNPNSPTHFVKVMGKFKTPNGQERVLFYAYTADEVIIFDSEKEVREEMMAERELDGKNPLGALPGVYINRSKHRLMPKPDTDTLSMTKLIPVLLSDLNFALMYQCFSIIYTIDCDQTDLKMSPDALWDLKSDTGSDKEPKVGSIKPEVDSDKALNMIRALFSLWMQTRNIKPGAIGDITVENAASGIAKALDEMDTSEDRQNQVPYFKRAEQELWALIQTKYHPMWSLDPDFTLRGMKFSPNSKVVVTFAEQRPNVDPSSAVDTQVKKINARLQTRRGALQELYPDWTDKQIDQKLAEIEEEDAKAKVELGSEDEDAVAEEESEQVA